MTERTGITKEGIVVVVGEGLSVAGLRMLAAIDKLKAIDLPRSPEIIVAEPFRREPDLDIRPLLLRERDHTAPRSPRKSFKKSSKR